MAHTLAARVEKFVQSSMKKDGQLVPARLQAALALLEKVRTLPSLNLIDHLASRGSSGLESHETFGNRVHKKLKLEPINKNHGRRSSSLQDWGQDLLDILRDAGFSAAKQQDRAKIIDRAQLTIAEHLRGILDQSPLEVRLRGRSVAAVIRDLLEQADEKGKVGDVAQYLVGAKLTLRFNLDIPVHQANKGDRKSREDRKSRMGDFEIENSIIEVAMGLPDAKHIAQIAEALNNTDSEAWLITRADRVGMWQSALDDEGLNSGRVVVTSVDAFVGQNITELGGFSARGKAARLLELFALYNSKWIKQVGTPGISIVTR